MCLENKQQIWHANGLFILLVKNITLSHAKFFRHVAVSTDSSKFEEIHIHIFFKWAVRAKESLIKK